MIDALAAVGAIAVPVTERPISVDEAMAAGTAPLERCGERLARLGDLLRLLPGNARVSADRLIDGLWGEDAPAGAASTLQSHVARLRRAGAVVLGKTNVGQLLLMIETDNPLYGRTNHPHALG